MSKETTSVSVNFVKQAHAYACNEWKQKIENEFPDLFEEKYKAGSHVNINGEGYLLVRIGANAYLCRIDNGNVWCSTGMSTSSGFVTKTQLNTYIDRINDKWRVTYHVKE
jgi:hypothetical protein